jgi:predicted secreted hydrolase
MNKRLAIFLFLLSIIIICVVFFSKSKKNDQGYSSSIEFLSNTSEEINKNFNSAIDRRDFDFPKDFGAHPDFMTEWWYYTGNVFTEDGRHFGYQLT